jgi:hypothetical protein
MAVLKYFDGSDWEPVVSALQGPTGPTGAASTITGPTGATGPTGSNASSGLVLINTTTFSAVSSISVNNVFTSTYDYYKVLINHTGSTTASNTIRLRLAGTDNTGANTYKTQENESDGSVNTATRRSGDAMLLGATSNTADSVCTNVIDIFNVALASPTGIQSYNIGSGSNGFMRIIGGYHTVSTAYDGFTFITASGTISGKLRVYGYAN